jgi:K+ transporter
MSCLPRDIFLKNILWKKSGAASIRKLTLKYTSENLKPPLMIPRILINLTLVFVVVAAVGYCVSESLKYGSAIGFILALTSLGAVIYFVYLLSKVKPENETEESVGSNE